MLPTSQTKGHDPMKALKLGLPLALIMAMTACSAPAAAPTDAPDDGNDPTASAPGSEDGGDGADASGYDLCDAISEDEVSATTGADVTESTSADLGGVLSCNYNTSDGAVAGTTLATSASGIDPRTMFDANQGAEGTEEIPDLGDGAVLTGDEDFPILMVMVNGNLYSLSVLAENLDGPGKREATIELARLSVDRLP
jgi:hypothetical protein